MEPWQLILDRVGELAEAQGRVEEKLDKLRDATVPRPEFEAYKLETDRRFRASDDRLTALASEKGQSHGAIRARLEKIEDDRKAAARVSWGAVLAAVGSIVAQLALGARLGG